MLLSTISDKNIFVVFLATTLSLSACSGGPGFEPPAEPASPASLTLWLSGQDASGESIEVSLDYRRDVDVSGPRVMELFIRHSGSLQLESASPGEAVTAAGKELVVQKRSSDTLRVVAFSSANLHTLGSGRLATFRFRASGPRPASMEILADRPVFAPASANQGLIMSDPLHIRIGSR